jgi:hypothetical protein
MNQDWATRDCMDWLPVNKPRPLAEKLLAIPEFNAKYQRFLDTIVREIINPLVIFQHIDSLKAIINDAAIADTYRTLDWGYTVADFNDGFNITIDGHTPYGIKPFLTTRYTKILQQLPAAGVTEFGISGSPFFIYPNPAVEMIIFRYASPSNIDRKGFILDITGRIQKSFVIPGNQEELLIPVSDLSPGVYIMEIMTNEGIVSKKFIKK